MIIKGKKWFEIASQSFVENNIVKINKLLKAQIKVYIKRGDYKALKLADQISNDLEEINDLYQKIKSGESIKGDVSNVPV